MSDELVQSVDKKICERSHITISEPSREFPQISCTVLYVIITVRLCYHHRFCARRIPKMFMGAYKMQRMALASAFFRAIPQRLQ
jgi:hypothetical protein